MISSKKISLFILASILIYGCEQSTDWELKTEGERRLVVEAILTNEKINQEIKLSQTYSALNEESPKVTNAIVTVTSNNIIYDFVADPFNDGNYKSETPFEVFDNSIYTLKIDWEGTIYEASSELSDVAPMPQITFNTIANTDSLIFGNFVPIYHPSQQAMYEMNVDWSHLVNDSITQARMFFYTFSSIHVSEFIRPPGELVNFPIGSIVIAKKFGLNDEFAEYLRAKAIETDWNGSFFYGNPENLPTNISNDAVGFFSTCAVVSDTLIAE